MLMGTSGVKYTTPVQPRPAPPPAPAAPGQPDGYGNSVAGSLQRHRNTGQWTDPGAPTNTAGVLRRYGQTGEWHQQAGAGGGIGGFVGDVARTALGPMAKFGDGAVAGLGQLGGLGIPGLGGGGGGGLNTDEYRDLIAKSTGLSDQFGATGAAGPSGPVRDQQTGLLGMLGDAAAGAGPSVAELAYRRAADEGIANQYAMAAAMGGRSAGGALRQASLGAADIQTRAAGDLGRLRAEEMLQNRGLLANTLTGVRGQDDAYRKMFMDSQLGALGLSFGGQGDITRALAAIEAAKMEANAKKTGALLGAGGAVLGSFVGGRR